MPISTTVAAPLRPTHQATCISVDPPGGRIRLLATWTKATEAAIGASRMKARSSAAIRGCASHRDESPLCVSLSIKPG